MDGGGGGADCVPETKSDIERLADTCGYAGYSVLTDFSEETKRALKEGSEALLRLERVLRNMENTGHRYWANMVRSAFDK